MSTLTHRDYRPFGDLFDWLETPLTVLRPLASHPVRVEDYLKDGRYVLRAELPGVDPDKDIDVTVSDGVLTIRATRHDETKDKRHSEFRYGAFARTVALPPGADEEHVQAVYGNGVLEVSVSLRKEEEEKPRRRIPVLRDQHINPT